MFQIKKVRPAPLSGLEGTLKSQAHLVPQVPSQYVATMPRGHAGSPEGVWCTRSGFHESPVWVMVRVL